MNHSNISDLYFYSGILLRDEYLRKIRKAMMQLRRSSSVLTKLEKKHAIEFGNPNSAVLPIAELITEWPSLRKKYSKLFDFSELDFRNILVSLSRQDTEDGLDSNFLDLDSISFHNWNSSINENFDDTPQKFETDVGVGISDAIHSVYLESSAKITTSRMEKAIRWTLYKVNLGFETSINSETNEMLVVLDLSKPRRTWDATSKLLQRKKNIPKDLTAELVQCESLVKEVIENHLPDLSKIIKHPGHVVVSLPKCFSSGWPNMISNPRGRLGRTTEFIFLDA